MAAVHAAIDANKSGGIPLGGWTSFENDTAPNDEWLQAGTTFDSDTYPELFLYLGGNTVPEKYDHSRLGAAESITSSQFTAPYDGVITIYGVVEARNESGAAYANGVMIARVYRDASSSASGFIKKGDVITFSGFGWMNPKTVAYYTHPMFIKATTTASSYTPSTAVQEIKDYTKDYVDAKNSYSTEETLTGGTWIDGKPIYKKTFICSSTMSFQSNQWKDLCPAFNGLSTLVPIIDELIDQEFSVQKNYNWRLQLLFLNYPNTGNLGIYSPVANDILVNSGKLTLYYTKTTD